MIDFSLNLLCLDQLHLLPLTLDSLKGQQASFEVILLDASSNKASEYLKHYQDLNLKVVLADGLNLAQMMNLGVGHSSGKYIQFMVPGERYISQYGLENLASLIEAEPFFIKANAVVQEVKTYWIQKGMILAFGGFDEKLFNMPLFDFLCRMQKKDIEPVVCSRVMMDTPKEKGTSFKEMCKILYRHFGFKAALKFFFKDNSKMLKKAFLSFRYAFKKES